MSYNPKQHHRRSIRLKNYDYTQKGAYFVTICTRNKQCIFGDIEKGKIKLNSLGKIAHDCWTEIPLHFPHIKLDVFVIMPNHIHGILWIEREIYTAYEKREYGKMIAGSIPCVIRSYKSSVTKNINQLCNQKGMSSVWQRNFYEYINRSEESLEVIRKYIIENPLKWEHDSENNHDISQEYEFLSDIPF